ncbi:MAG: hypothetical protein ACJ79E_01730 [Anaeromyxobacteraceae bacterium]
MLARSVSDLVANACHAAPLDGATCRGEAGAEPRLLVHVGLWVAEDGRVARARYRATTCAALVAYAEAACTLLEERGPVAAVEPAHLRRAVKDAHPVHHDRADLVALAVARALAAPPRPGETA